MLKRFLYGGLFAIVCAGLVVVILLQRFDKITPIEVLRAVPEDAIVFIENIDYEYLTETFLPRSRIWIDFVNTTGQSGLDSMINMALAQVNSSEPIQEFLMKEGLNLSLHLIGKDQLMPLFYIRYSEFHSDHDFEQFMLSLLDGQAMVNDRKYEAETLYDVSGKPGFVPEVFSFTCINGICLISSSSMLVEESVRTIHAEGNFSTDKGLQLIRETAGRYVHANIYINYEKLQLLFYPFINHSSWERLKPLSGLATWGELDLDVKENAIVLNGMTHADQEAILFLNAFADQSQVKMEVHEIMPSGTTYFLHLGISDQSKFAEQMIAYFTGLGTWPEIETELGRVEKLYGINPLEDLMGILDDEMAWFAIEGETAKPEDEVLVIETKSQSETGEVVMRWIEQYLQVHTFNMRSLLHVYQLDNQTSFNIYRLPDPFFKGMLPGRLFNRYFTIFENYLIFGPSVEVLSRVIYQNILHKTFSSDPVFKEMSDYLSNRSNISLFFRPYAYLDYKRALLNKKGASQLDLMELFLRRIPGVVIQYSTEDRLFYHSISWKYTSQIKEKALTVWESLLDSVVVIKPVLVMNHITSEKEIFVQDATSKIYLINSTGRILWEQRLEGPIMGDLFQVDFHKNGKLQYLFNTREKLHLIDRNGNYVERYPISLRSNATNPIALFDYDNGRDYRVFVAGEDRKIYVYDIEGNVVTGWKFGKTESTVTRALQHFRISENDYIVVSDNNRTYFLDRRGRERIKLKDRVVVSSQNPLTLDMNIREERPRWISTDTSGNVTCIYLDGSVSTLLKQKVSPDHFFRMQDMDKDGIPEFIFADGNELNVLYQDGKRLFGYRVRERISDMPDIYKFSASDIKIGITDRLRNRIYLINSDGSLYEGFPLEGSTRFSLGYFAGSDSRFNLIVGSANNFLYNYSIE
ncbi:MAG: PQQ-binding-like beta-propeller repeat protein [Bacteroidales bacterium]|nr:PQQ-binding-like beta-propeller repeat protein [Bacteroidales bacterium]